MRDGEFRSRIRKAQALIWGLLLAGVCGLLLVLNEVAGRPVWVW